MQTTVPLKFNVAVRLHILKCWKRKYKVRCKILIRVLFVLFPNILENGFEVDQISEISKGTFLINIKIIFNPTLC